ncbi:MAG: FKBP-type peptidyl-prolyl cis-trans isomerase [bacterium]|nr:FKBP-type peptidyl-prolyl cis-trans isomerase [bacterium]MDI1337292.1 FKBP-type peptidyl-prolyl cis-trans isomerase [Lacunisphaera sp.]
MTPAALRRLAFLTFALLALGAAPLHAQREKLPMEDLEIVEKKWPNTKRTYTGLRYIVLKPATDPKSAPAGDGAMCSVVYKGMLLDGTVFDETADPKAPLRARIGRGELIQGWDEALQLMRRGEKWLLIVPPEMAYGSRGRPPAIKRNATLVFEMELVDFEKK